ncbi:MAG: ferritin-like domain-containing protein [Alphaproteobacteria bacterium]|nr:ferritin-like domain-containing protein [Alphaproteobacteria bacterium]
MTAHPTVRARWQARTRAEQASAHTMELLAARFEALVPERAGVATALRRTAADERRHQGLCAEVVTRLGGDAEAGGPLPGLPPAEGEARGALMEHVVFLLCAGEAIAAAMLRVAAGAATAPGVTELLRGIAADEARHAALGWVALDAALDGLSAEARREAAPRLSRQVLRAVVAARAVGAAGPDGAAWGLLEGARAVEVAKQAVEAAVIPELVARGLWAPPGAAP